MRRFSELEFDELRYSNSRPSTLFFRHASQKRASDEKKGERHGNVADRRARDPPNYRQSVVRERADSTSRIFIAIDDRIKDGREVRATVCTGGGISVGESHDKTDARGI